MGDETSARWTAWLAPMAFIVAFATVAVIAAVLTALAVGAGLMDADSDPPSWNVLLTVIQDVVFVVTAVVLGRSGGVVTMRTFGLTPVGPAHAAAWVVGALAVFWALSAAWVGLVGTGGEQDVLESFGADAGTGSLVRAGVLVILLAPVAEEILFRGLIYRSLRNRLPVVAAAATVGAVFASVHWSGPDTLPLLPPLALLGALFCLVYERTGSLWPAIALHALNNAIAFGATGGREEAPFVGAVLGAIAVTACLAGARMIGRGAGQRTA